jgi:hypothetical protein
MKSGRCLPQYLSLHRSMANRDPGHCDERHWEEFKARIVSTSLPNAMPHGPSIVETVGKSACKNLRYRPKVVESPHVHVLVRRRRDAEPHILNAPSTIQVHSRGMNIPPNPAWTRDRGRLKVPHSTGITVTTPDQSVLTVRLAPSELRYANRNIPNHHRS